MKSKIPKDLGLKIGTKPEVFWTQVRDTAQASLEESKYNIMLQREVVDMAERQIKIEQELMKKP